jgi:hypothetical protein
VPSPAELAEVLSGRPRRRNARRLAVLAFVGAVSNGARAAAGEPATAAPVVMAPASAGPGERSRPVVHEPGQPVPAGHHLQHRTRYGLAISGAVLFAVTYLPTAAAAYYDGSDGTILYVVPVLGPLFAIPNKTASHCTNVDHDPCLDFSGYIAAFLIMDALVQAGGIAMAWYGLRGRDVVVRDETAPTARLVPGRVGTSGYGAWLQARF